MSWIEVPWQSQPPPGTPINLNHPLAHRLIWFAHFGRGVPFEEWFGEFGTPGSSNLDPVANWMGAVAGSGVDDSNNASCDFVKHDELHVGISEITIMSLAWHRKTTMSGEPTSESTMSYTGTGNDPWDVRWGTDDDVDFLIEADSGNTTYQDNVTDALGPLGENPQQWNLIGGTWRDNNLIGRVNRQVGPGTTSVGPNTGDASATNNPRLLGRQQGQALGWDGYVAFGAVWDRDIGEAAWLEFTKNPWLLFVPQQVFIDTTSVIITDVNTTESWPDGSTGVVATGSGFM